jgi:hypothetical protein
LQMYIPIEDVRVAPPKQEKKEKTTTWVSSRWICLVIF